MQANNMKRQKPSLFLIFVGFLLVFPNCVGNSDPVVQRLFPDPPDTSNLFYLSNFTQYGRAKISCF